MGEVEIASPSVAEVGDISPQVGRLGALFFETETKRTKLTNLGINLSLSWGDVSEADRAGTFLSLPKLQNTFILRSRVSGVSQGDGILAVAFPSSFETRKRSAPQDEGNFVRGASDA